VVLTLPSLSDNRSDDNLYWKITKVPYINKPVKEVYNFEPERIEFKFKENKKYIYYIVWNTFDVYTTHKAIKDGYAVESNPIVKTIIGTETPSLESLILYKAGINYYYYKIDLLNKEEFITFTNVLGTLILVNNFYIMSQN